MHNQLFSWCRLRFVWKQNHADFFLLTLGYQSIGLNPPLCLYPVSSPVSVSYPILLKSTYNYIHFTLKLESQERVQQLINFPTENGESWLVGRSACLSVCPIIVTSLEKRTPLERELIMNPNPKNEGAIAHNEHIRAKIPELIYKWLITLCSQQMRVAFRTAISWVLSQWEKIPASSLKQGGCSTMKYNYKLVA